MQRFCGGGHYCKAYGENRFCAETKQPNGRLRKLLNKTILCCILSPNQLQMDQRASGQLSKELHITIQDQNLYGLLSQYMTSLQYILKYTIILYLPVSQVYSSRFWLRHEFQSLTKPYSLMLRQLCLKLFFCLLHFKSQVAGFAVFSKEKAINEFRLLIPFYFLQCKMYLCTCIHWNKYLRR